jgi:hypothetical protein
MRRLLSATGLGFTNDRAWGRNVPACLTYEDAEVAARRIQIRLAGSRVPRRGYQSTVILASDVFTREDDADRLF